MSSLPLPNPPRVPNISKTAQPYPGDYTEVVTRRLLSRGEAAEISEPVAYEPWSINDPLSWSSCLRRENGKVTLVVLSPGKVTGTVVPAPVGYCETATYSPIARGDV